MFGSIIGGLLGAGGSLLGGIMGSNNASQQFWQNVKMQNRAFKRQQLWNRRTWDFTNKWADINARRATTKWKVQDALRGGVHPLYALGGNSQVGVSTPSISVGGGSPGYSGDGGLAASIGNAGQSIGRAVDAMATHEQRNTARLYTGLQIENQGLQNELLRSQIRRINSQVGPALPGPGTKYMIDGQGNSVNKTDPDSVVFSQRYPESKQNIQLGPIHQANPYVSNAEDVEARHGELADMLWGGITIPADIYWNYLRDRNKGYDMWGSGSGNPIGP